jgi:hypothetical protein
MRWKVEKAYNALDKATQTLGTTAELEKSTSICKVLLKPMYAYKYLMSRIAILNALAQTMMTVANLILAWTAKLEAQANVAKKSLDATCKHFERHGKSHIMLVENILRSARSSKSFRNDPLRKSADPDIMKRVWEAYEHHKDCHPANCIVTTEQRGVDKYKKMTSVLNIGERVVGTGSISAVESANSNFNAGGNAQLQVGMDDTACKQADIIDTVVSDGLADMANDATQELIETLESKKGS